MKLVEGRCYRRRDGTVTKPLQRVLSSDDRIILEDTETEMLFCGCGGDRCRQALAEPSSYDLVGEALQ